MFDGKNMKWNLNRISLGTKLIIFISVAVLLLLTVLFLGIFITPEKYAVNYAEKFISPSKAHPFGTDFMGRDMFFRCIKGLSTSIVIGICTTIVSSVIALVFGISSAVIGGKFDKFVLFCVDCCMGLPHIVLLILISFLLGRGERGVIFSIALTHWPELTRLVRSEVLQVRSKQYIAVAYKMGKTRLQVAAEHIFPHVLPVYIVGMVMTFPHAIVHESSITFLGFGLPAETPAIGIILSEAMKHIVTGKWWLAVFPGLMLIAVVLLFHVIGESMRKIFSPVGSRE